MSFLAGLFLWGLLGLSIPVAIALWNRRRYKKENFGAFFLLKKFSRVSQRRIRLLEFLKLLNRLAFLTLLILVFAQPLQQKTTISGADEGFVVYLDVSRDLFRKAPDGRALHEHLYEQVRAQLGQLPSGVQGMIAFVSDHCDFFELSNSSTTARANEFLSELSETSFPLSSRSFRMEAFQQCQLRARSIFGDREVYQAFISPLPDLIQEDFLSFKSIDVRRLPISDVQKSPLPRVRQDQSAEQPILRFEDFQNQEVSVINEEGDLVQLGNIQERMSLPVGRQSWVWIEGSREFDPFVQQKLIPVERSEKREIVLWAEQQSEGLQSLHSALRNHPELEVRLVIGPEARGSSIIAYGVSRRPSNPADEIWYFLSPERPSPFPQRDQKQWLPAAELSDDLRRSFVIESEEASIFVRRYLLLSLDGLETLESFQDGAPSLMMSRETDSKVWITPFDLEDLTTDLTLEASFIPYLYRKLEDWLDREATAEEAEEWLPVWTMPAGISPHPLSLERRTWPGLYRTERGQFQVVEADTPSESFLEWQESASVSEVRNDFVPLRAEFFPWLAFSLLLELLLCGLFGRGRWIALVFVSLSFFSHQELNAQTKSFEVAYLEKMESDRLESLRQLLVEVQNMANLDIAPPAVVNWKELWRYSLLVLSSRSEWSLKDSKQRAALREYLERGGLILFDDPLAESGTLFKESVRKELEEVFPGRKMERLSREAVVFRTYYLLQEVSGRRLAEPYLEGLQLDDRWVALYSANDLLGAILKTSLGDYALSVSPYGPVQRSLSQRLLINVLMYSVTGDYKDDAIHLPHILRRRTR